MLKQGSLIATFQALNIVMALITSVLIARIISPEDYGIYSFTIAVITLLALPSVSGLTPLVTREIAKYRSQNKFNLINGIIKFSSRISYFVSFLTISISTLVIAVYFYNSIYKFSLLLGLVLIPLSAAAAIRGSIMKGFELSAYSVGIDQFGRSFFLLALILVLNSQISNAEHVVFLNIISVSVVFLISTLVVRGVLKKKVDVKEYKFEVSAWLAALMPFAIIAYVQVASMQVNIILLGIFSSPESVAMFKVATNGALAVGLFQVAINTVIAPVASKAFATGELVLLRKRMRKLTQISTSMALICFVIIFIYGNEAITLTFGPDYTMSYLTMLILGFGQLISTACGPCNILLNMSNNQKRTVVAVSIGLLMNLILCVFLIPILGHIGGAISFALSMIVWNLILVIKARKILNINTLISL